MRLLTIFIVFGMMCSMGSSIRCYQCSSVSSSCSTSSLSGIEATDCGTGYTVCKKIHAEIFGIETETRLCEKSGSDGCSSAFGLTTCICSTDGCNGSDSAKVDAIFFLTSAILCWVFA